MNQWYDNCLLGGFINVFLYTMGIIIICLVIGSAIVIFNRVPAIFENQLGSCITCLLGFYMLISILCSIKVELKTFKIVTLFSGRISGWCYFRTKFNIDFDDIIEIREYKISYLMKQMKLFCGEKKGFEIKLKNGKSYLVSPHMSDMENLKQTLIEGMNSIHG